MTEPNWTRRHALAAMGGVPAAMLVPSVPAWALQPGGGAPVARVEPVSEALWGETIVNPYRWMENAMDRDWEPFMKGWAGHTRGVLDAVPGRKRLAERIGKLMSISTPLARGRCTERNIDALRTTCAWATGRCRADLRYKVNGSAEMTDTALVRA